MKRLAVEDEAPSNKANGVVLASFLIGDLLKACSELAKNNKAEDASAERDILADQE